MHVLKFYFLGRGANDAKVCRAMAKAMVLAASNAKLCLVESIVADMFQFFFKGLFCFKLLEKWQGFYD
jgi:hypothetical protein